MRFLVTAGIMFVLVSVIGCRDKNEVLETEISEAGYEVSREGWFRAIETGDLAVLQKMVEAGFDAKTVDSDGQSGLHVAATFGSQEIADFLVNRGLRVDLLDLQGRTPLMSSVVADQTGMTRWFLRQGADPSLKDKEGYLPLMLAVSIGNAVAVEELAPYHREELDSALLLAALSGDTKMIDTLTNYGASVYAQMDDGRTALMLAAQNGHEEAAQLLIDIGASRFTMLENGETAQSLAEAGGHYGVADLIATGVSEASLALDSEETISEAFLVSMEKVEDAAEGTFGDEVGSHLEVNVGAESSPELAEVTKSNLGLGSKETLVEDRSAGEEVPIAMLENAEVRLFTGAEGPADGNVPVRGVTRGGGEDHPERIEKSEPWLVMRQYRQRELPIQVKNVSGDAADLYFQGDRPEEQGGVVRVGPGERIPRSRLEVVRVFSRQEVGKLNDGAPVEVGVVVVEDTDSGNRAEWVSGRPASGHEPVALVEDGVTGRRYVAQRGQEFSAEDGRRFRVNDVRPTQLLIEEVATGRVRTLRLRGPQG